MTWPKTFNVRLTWAHVSDGMKGCSTCPIALAIKDRGYHGTVGDRSATVSLPTGENAEYRLPERARAFVRQFDSGGGPWPISFRMTLIPTPRWT